MSGLEIVPADRSSNEPALGVREARNLLGFVKAAVHRQRRRFVILVLLVSALVVAGALSLPRSYAASSRILVQTNYQMPALANPHRTVPMYGEDPTRAVAPMLLSQKNLEWVVDTLNLAERWKAHRGTALRLKDEIHDLFLGPLTPAEMKEALVKLLRRHVAVQAGQDVVNIYVTWTDPDTTLRIARILTDRFIEERRDRETGAITDTLAVLEQHAGQEKGRVDGGLVTLRQLREDRSKKVTRVAVLPRTTVRERRAASAQLTEVASELAAKQRAIAVVEAQRESRLANLRATLRERSTVLAQSHPDIVELKRNIRLLETQTPELDRLRQQAAQIRSRYERLRQSSQEMPTEATAAEHRVVQLARSEVVGGDPSELSDPDIANARSQLLNALDAYDDILNRIAGAQIELDIAAAAFKYRYSVVDPPKLPEKPDKPNLVLLLISGLLGAVLLGLVASVGSEIAAQRLLVPWQVQRQLHMPLLGKVEQT